MGERVVLTGMGLLTSVGVGPRAFADAILAGRSGFSPVTAFETSDCRSHLAGKLQGFDASRYIKPAKLRRIDNIGRVAVSASRLAIEDAGLELGEDGSDRIGVVVLFLCLLVFVLATIRIIRGNAIRASSNAVQAAGGSLTNRSFTWEMRSWCQTLPAGGESACRRFPRHPP